MGGLQRGISLKKGKTWMYIIAGFLEALVFFARCCPDVCLR
jgi:hypothetical protein